MAHKTKKYIITDNGVRFRSLPEISGETILSSFSKGTEVLGYPEITHNYDSENWIYATINEKIGWISSRYLKEVFSNPFLKLITK